MTTDPAINALVSPATGSYELYPDWAARIARGEPAAPALEVSPALRALAQDWELYMDYSEVTCRFGEFCRTLPAAAHTGPHQHTVQAMRCRQCDEAVAHPDVVGVMAHLCRSHGYRMDGRRFDNANREIGHV